MANMLHYRVKSCVFIGYLTRQNHTTTKHYIVCSSIISTWVRNSLSVTKGKNSAFCQSDTNVTTKQISDFGLGRIACHLISYDLVEWSHEPVDASSLQGKACPCYTFLVWDYTICYMHIRVFLVPGGTSQWPSPSDCCQSNWALEIWHVE